MSTSESLTGCFLLFVRTVSPSITLMTFSLRGMATSFLLRSLPRPALATSSSDRVPIPTGGGCNPNANGHGPIRACLGGGASSGSVDDRVALRGEEDEILSDVSLANLLCSGA